MKCMEYANAHHINIIPQNDFLELTHEVFSVIADNLSRSLGPLGSSATIFNGAYVEATKDGFAILKSYSFNNRYKKMIYNLIKGPCTKMNNTVGDGTTTAIALTNEIYKLYEANRDDLYRCYRLPRHFIKVWDTVVEQLITGVREQATPIDPEDADTIYNIAYVVSNGNEEVSKAVAEVYKEAKSPSIKVKDSPSNKSYITPIDGFEFPTNVIDPAYVRNQDLSSTETNIATLVIDHTVDSDIFEHLIMPVNDVMRAKNKKLVVIAPSYDAYMAETKLGQYINFETQRYGRINLILTQYRSGEIKDTQLNDLAVILRSKPLNQTLVALISQRISTDGVDTALLGCDDPENEIYRCIGYADSGILTCKNGCIFKASGLDDDQYYQDALLHAQAELTDAESHVIYEAQSLSVKTHDARARLLNLQMRNYIYYVGADSDLQKQILQDSIIDVIKCLSSATKHGVVPGCQLAVISTANAILDQINTMENKDEDEIILFRMITTIIRDACINVYKRVLNGPDNDGVKKLLKYWKYLKDTPEANKAMQQDIITLTGDIIAKSLETNSVFDLETLTFSKAIITSAETDTMVLTAASELIKILITGNQCIFIDADINQSHQDSVEVYV